MTTTDLDKLAKFVHREMVASMDRSGEIAALQNEVAALKHQVMKLRLENDGLYAKIERLKAGTLEF